mmetsp:Transcript_17842/g.21983  ORF Transcript_17842/g.21983 Transcript_17842/m.21983 type:complete len:446 (+) Transcript_17842:404-1741(+)
MNSRMKATMEEGGFTYVSHKRRNRRRQRPNPSLNTRTINRNSNKQQTTLRKQNQIKTNGFGENLSGKESDSDDEISKWIGDSIQKSIQDSIDDAISKSIDASIDASIEAALAHQLSQLEQNHDELHMYTQKLNNSINEPLKKLGLVEGHSNKYQYEVVVLEILGDVYAKRNYVEKSEFFSTWVKTMRSHLNTENSNDIEGGSGKKKMRRTIRKIVCLGIGSFQSHSPNHINSRFQLAALLAMQSFIGTMNQREDNNRESLSCLVEVFDPLLELTDRHVISSLTGFSVGSDNNEGKTCLAYRENPYGKSDHIVMTMFFMPHCSLRLYSNVLWSNWGKESLSRILIVGNSFANYETRLTLSSDEDEIDNTNCVLLLRKYVKESKLWQSVSRVKSKIQSREDISNGILFERAFNDTSMMSFTTLLDGEGDHNKLFQKCPPEYKGNVLC